MKENSLHAGTVTLKNLESFTVKQLYTKALEMSPNNADILAVFADSMSKTESVTLPNDKCFTKKGLYFEALIHGGRKMAIYGSFACTLDDGETFTLPNGCALTQKQLFLETLHMCPNFTPVKQQLTFMSKSTDQWSRIFHILYSDKTNILFSTLLLGLQKMEDQGLIPLAHQAMLEDALTFWTWGDDYFLLQI